MALFEWVHHKITRYRLARVFACMNQLQYKIFYIFLKRDYLEKHYFYEKELHLERLRYFSLITRLYQSTVSKKMLQKIDELFEIITAVGNLRYRMDDHVIFETCETELFNITRSLSLNFKQLKLHESVNTDALDANIQALEAIYAKALSIALKEPLDFQIFIQDLMALKDKLEWMTAANYHDG